MSPSGIVGILKDNAAVIVTVCCHDDDVSCQVGVGNNQPKIKTTIF